MNDRHMSARVGRDLVKQRRKKKNADPSHLCRPFLEHRPDPGTDPGFLLEMIQMLATDDRWAHNSGGARAVLSGSPQNG